MQGMMNSNSRGTPGKALTSSHRDGTRDMTIYYTWSMDIEPNEMTFLVIDDDVLAVTVDDGSVPFKAEVQGDMLVLSTEG